MDRLLPIQRGFLLLSVALASALLLRAAFDFCRHMPLTLSLPAATLVAGSIAVAFANAIASASVSDKRGFSWLERLLLASIPLAFLVCSLACSGLRFSGCTPFCTFTKTAWIPLLAVGSALHLLVGAPWTLLGITAASFVPLVPHCLCSNIVNAWWIQSLGASPVCYAWGLLASVISVGALHGGRRHRLALVVNSTMIAAIAAFFAGHHYLRFPW